MMALVMEFLNRIPADLWTVLLTALGAWIYFRFIGPRDIGTVLADELGTFMVIDILVTRLSLFILYPSAILHVGVWTLLSQPPASGWGLGALTATLYVGLSLRKRGQARRRTLQVALTGLAFGGIVYFACVALTSFAPFQMQAVLRLFMAVGTALWLWRRQNFPLRNPERLFGLYGALLFASSALVPHVNKLGWLGFSQWAFLALIFVSALLEANHDWRATKHRGN